MSNPVTPASEDVTVSMEVVPTEHGPDTDYESVDEEDDGGSDVPDDYEYWREEGEGNWTHHLLEGDEDDDGESDPEDESDTALLSHTL